MSVQIKNALEIIRVSQEEAEKDLRLKYETDLALARLPFRRAREELEKQCQHNWCYDHIDHHIGDSVDKCSWCGKYR